jgi:hypothetical protein
MNYLLAFWTFVFLIVVIGCDIYYRSEPDYLIYILLFLEVILLLSREWLGRGLRGGKGLKNASDATAKSREF